MASTITTVASNNQSDNVTAPFVYPPALLFIRAHLWKILLSFVVIGVFGNSMILIIIYRLRTKPSPIDPFLLSMAIFDMIVNVVYMLPPSLDGGFRIILHNADETMCKIYYYISPVAYLGSKYTLMAMSIQRALSVVWPHRIGLLCTPRRIKSVIIGITVFSVVFISPQLYWFGLTINSGRGPPECNIRVRDKTLIQFIINYTAVKNSLDNQIPCIVLLITNVVLVFHLRKSDITSESSATAQRKHQKVNSITLTTFALTTTFVLLMLPNVTYGFYINYIPSHGISTYEWYTRAGWGAICDTIGAFNFCTNFYVYCLTGRRYRDEVLKLFGLYREQKPAKQAILHKDA